MRTTKDQRRAMYTELGRKFDRWLKSTDEDLLKEVQNLMPSVTSATREECIKFLTMDHANRMVD